MPGWNDIDTLLLAEAELDLRLCDGVRPRLVAFRGDTLLFLAELRAFEAGGYHAPMTEVLALAGGMAADRLAFATGGRAWSLDDPVVPVVDGADLRQRVFIIESVDGRERPARSASTLWPFSVSDDGPVWDDPVEPGPAEGWIAGALRVTVQQRHLLAAPIEQLRDQAERCLELGHDIAFEVDTAAELWLPPAVLP